MNQTNTRKAPDRRRIGVKVVSRFIPAIVLIAAIVILPAGSLSWMDGWIYLGTIVCLMLGTLAYLLVHDPELLEKRMRTRERVKSQKACAFLSVFIILPIFALPGLDWRFGWSTVPAYVTWIGVALLAAGFALFVAVMGANSFASRVIEVQEGQKVIDSGPYSIVRHPMYVSSIIIYAATPLVLGSWWALAPTIAYLPFIVMRVRDEEALLRQGLPGYSEYCGRVKWRILPGLW
jgi:protein-S-isoprenylcysteine O-methyltransferase Ste14